MKQTEKRNASSYCNYNDTFISYDQNRQPNGPEEILYIFEERNEANSLIRSNIDDGSVHQHMEQTAKQAEKIGEAVIVSGPKAFVGKMRIGQYENTNNNHWCLAKAG